MIASNNEIYLPQTIEEALQLIGQVFPGEMTIIDRDGTEYRSFGYAYEVDRIRQVEGSTVTGKVEL